MNLVKYMGRKLFHVVLGVGFLFCIQRSLDNFGKEKTLIYGGLLLIALLVVEVLRIDYGFKLYNYLTKEKEIENYHAVVYALTIAIIVFSLFDRNIAFAAMSISIFGDWAASIGGRFFGRHKIWYNKDKTWEGVFCYVVVGMVVAAYFMSIWIVFPMAFVAALIESVTKRTEDNFIIPLVIGFLGYIIG